jgi:hypothetical protein
MATADDPRDENPPPPRAWRRVVDVGVGVGLAAVLGLVYALDPRTTAPPPPTITDRPGQGTVEQEPLPPPPPPAPVARAVDPLPRVALATLPSGRFGVVCLEGNPDDPSDDGKRLTFSPHGATSNTRVMVDGSAPVFGQSPGALVEPMAKRPDGSWVMSWKYRGVVAAQVLRLVAGDVSHRTDTLHVSYTLTNTDDAPRVAGVRVMLDMRIGDNDGVPFIVPGRPGIVTGPLELAGAAVPDFVQSLERSALERPGVIVDIGLVPRDGEERPDELVLSHWPGEDAEWLYGRRAPFEGDTALGLYYTPRPLAPGAARRVGFTYGLGTISSTATKNTRLSLTAGGPIRSGSSFWLVALVNDPKRGQTVRLTLPAGLTVRQPPSLSQPVPVSGGYTQLSWLVAVSPTLFGEVTVEAALEPGVVNERQTLTVRPPDAALTLTPYGPYRAGRSFWVSALVRNARAGQSVALDLPAGLATAEDQARVRPVAPAVIAGGYAQVSWLVVADVRATGPHELTVRLRPDGVEARATIDILPTDLTH